MSILANLSNAVVWIVLILLLISIYSNLLSKSLEIVPSAPTTIGITITLMFYNFLSSLAKSKSFSIVSLSFISAFWSARTAKSIWLKVLFILLILQSAQTAKSTILEVLFFFFFFFFFFFVNYPRSGRLAGIRWSVYFLWVFPTNISWRWFTGVWVTASLLGPPGLFAVSWLTLDGLSSSFNFQHFQPPY